MKYRFVQYTENFGSAIDQPEYMGILGPLITAETGDVVKVHLQVSASLKRPGRCQAVQSSKKGDGSADIVVLTLTENRALKEFQQLLFLLKLTAPDCLRVGCLLSAHTE